MVGGVSTLFERGGPMSDTSSTFCGNKYNFIQMPNAIRVRKDLDIETKFLYAYLFTTSNLSFNNSLCDDGGVYVFVNFRELFNWKKELIKSRLDQLEKANLIHIEHSIHPRQKSKVYVFDFDNTPIQEYFTPESIQRFSFLRIPFDLAFDSRFLGITTDAMVLYAFYIDLKTLSSKNNNFWDSENKVFIEFSSEDAKNLLGWSRTKFWRVNEFLKTFNLIEVKRSGNGQNNRVYPKDYLFTKKPGVCNDKEKQMFQNNKADVSKTDIEISNNEQMFQNNEADVSKTDIEISNKEQMFQNNEADVSFSDVTKTDVSRTGTNKTYSSSFSKLTTSINTSVNQILVNLVEDNFAYENKMKKSDRLKLEDQLCLKILDNNKDLDEENLLKFIDFQMSLTDRLESLQTAYEVCSSRNEFGNAHLHSTNIQFYENMRAVLYAVYSDNEEMNKLIKNCHLNPINVRKNLLKLKPEHFEKIAERLVKYVYDIAMTGDEITNLPAFLIKTLNNESTLILPMRI
jgi:hypothetical protein